MKENGEFRYGMNPGQRATFLAVDEARSVKGVPLSLNAYLDVATGVRLIHYIGATVNVAVYVKHRIPLVVCTGPDAAATLERFVRKVLHAKNVGFGCVVTSFPCGDWCEPLIGPVRMHTLAAPGFGQNLLDRLNDEQTQAVNHGLAAVRTDGQAWPTDVSLNLSSGGSICFDDAPDTTALDREGTPNALWERQRTDVRVGLATLAQSRTIAVVMQRGADVVFNRAGFFDGAEALEQTLSLASASDIELEGTTVLTDGCFGVQMPLDILERFGIGAFVFGGGKRNDEALLAGLAERGIAALRTADRFFSFA
jgi:AICAR transformylase/IMP cyclohydrolase PurH